MARIGYARVSTTDQDLDTQLAKLTAEGCEIIRSEKVSGGSRDGRIELATIIDFLRPGDELVVTRLDRLGRDTRDVLNLKCEQKGAFLTVLDPHVSTRGQVGHIVLTVLGMVAQMERRFIKERQREGIEKAKDKGVYRAENPVSTTSISALFNAMVSSQLRSHNQSDARGCKYTGFSPIEMPKWLKKHFTDTHLYHRALLNSDQATLRGEAWLGLAASFCQLIAKGRPAVIPVQSFPPRLWSDCSAPHPRHTSRSAQFPEAVAPSL